MLIALKEGFLTLTPENVEDREKLAATFGRPESVADDHGYREFHEKARGLHISLNTDGQSVDIAVADAWWNYDS
ncbi:hypothetical protein [Paraburkholderia kururiensis]|uniref:hypothetical protein n=1 Tax=Paraburkholderia kururiensis TaxID=984307 RepID=UPI0012E043B5|nr:hypothetical protein [Paraburkholderia kururiensis]